MASDEAGQSYHPDRLTSAWGRMLDELGIKRVRLHDARHSCATLMHLRGVPIAVIAAWLGHASAAFTLSVYAHSQDDALKAAAGSFGRVVTTRDTETGSEGRHQAWEPLLTRPYSVGRAGLEPATNGL